MRIGRGRLSRFAAFAVLAVIGLAATSAAAPLEDQISRAFRDFLKQRPGNPTAERTLEFFDAHPAVRMAVQWTTMKPDQWAESRDQWGGWDQAGMEVTLSSRPFAAYGVTSSAQTLSDGQLKDYLFRNGAVIVHELSHARSQSELPFDLPGPLEDEVLAWTVESLFLRSEGRLADPTSAYAGKVWVKELMPLNDRLYALAGKIDAVALLRTAASREEAQRLYEQYLRLTESRREIRARLARKAPGLEEAGYGQQLAVAWAFDQACSSLPALVKVIYPKKRSLLAAPEDLARDLAGERLREDLLETSCPQMEQGSPNRAWCDEKLAVLRRGIAFWSDPRRVAAARRYFESQLAPACGGR